MGSILEPFWEPKPPLYSFWGGAWALLGGNKESQKTYRFLMPTFRRNCRKWTSKWNTGGLTFWHLFGPFWQDSTKTCPEPLKSQKTNKKSRKPYNSSALCLLIFWAICCNGVPMHSGSMAASAFTKTCTKKENAIVAPSLSRIQVHISQAQYPELLSICPKICCNYFRREL